MTSPTQRTLAECRKLGWTVQIVERWNPYARVRVDLFGCIDIVALSERTNGILGIQACAGSSHAARRTKALAEPKLRQWLKAGGWFEVWSWSKTGARGKRKLWTLRRERITLDMMPPPAARLEQHSLPRRVAPPAAGGVSPQQSKP